MAAILSPDPELVRTLSEVAVVPEDTREHIKQQLAASNIEIIDEEADIKSAYAQITLVSNTVSKLTKIFGNWMGNDLPLNLAAKIAIIKLINLLVNI